MKFPRCCTVKKIKIQEDILAQVLLKWGLSIAGSIEDILTSLIFFFLEFTLLNQIKYLRINIQNVKIIKTTQKDCYKTMNN